jgi:hypothetical protein
MMATMGSAVMMAGCPTLEDLSDWAQTGILAVTALLNLLGSFNIIPVGAGTAAATLIAAVTLAFNDIVADVKTYNATPSDTLLQKIQATLQQISTQVSGFISALPIPDGAAEKLISSLLTLLLTTIAGFIAEVAQKMGSSPATAAATARRTVPMGSSHATLVIEPIHIGKAKFVRQWNGITHSAGHQEADIH